MISFVPLAISYQTDLPKEFPKFIISVGEIAFFTYPAALFQISYWSDEEGIGIGGDFLYLSLVWEAYVNWKSSKEIEIEVEESDKDD